MNLSLHCVLNNKQSSIRFILVLICLLKKSSYVCATAQGENEEKTIIDGNELTTLVLPSLILTKTSNPISNEGPVKDLGTFPMKLCEKVFNIDVANTEEGRALISKYLKAKRDDEIDSSTSSSCEVADINTTLETLADKETLQINFGKSFLEKAKELFESENLLHECTEFIETSKSNKDRHLYWTTAEIFPHQVFELHAHPNIEIAYVIQGTVHERRLVQNSSLVGPKKLLYKAKSSKGALLGPNLTHVEANDETFKYYAYRKGDVFFNDIGGVHQPFTKEDGAKLLVLWGGNHAYLIPELYPKNFNEFFSSSSVEQLM